MLQPSLSQQENQERGADLHFFGAGHNAANRPMHEQSAGRKTRLKELGAPRVVEELSSAINTRARQNGVGDELQIVSSHEKCYHHHCKKCPCVDSGYIASAEGCIGESSSWGRPLEIHGPTFMLIHFKQFSEEVWIEPSASCMLFCLQGSK